MHPHDLDTDDVIGFSLDPVDLFAVEWAATRENFVVVDLETTGFVADAGEVLRIAALLVSPDGRVLSEFSELVRVADSVPQWLLDELELSVEDIERDGKQLADVIKSFMTFIGNLPVFIHHAPFDIPFLKAAAALTDQVFLNPIYDTLAMAAVTWPELPGHRSKTLAGHVGMVTFADDELGDVKLCLAVLMAAREFALAHWPGSDKMQ